MTNEEINRVIECYIKLRDIYPDDELILCNPKTYGGYTLATGKRIMLKVVELDASEESKGSVLEP